MPNGDAPQSLPADFFSKKQKSAPTTLPADFFSSKGSPITDTSKIGPAKRQVDVPFPDPASMVMGIPKMLRQIAVPFENMTQEGRTEHPWLAKAGDVSRNLKSLLFGGGILPGSETPLGHVSGGVLNNPVTMAMSAVPGTAELAASLPGKAVSLYDRAFGVSSAMSKAREAQEAVRASNLADYMLAEQKASQATTASEAATKAENISRYRQSEQDISTANEAARSEAISANKARYMREEQEVSEANVAAYKKYAEKNTFPAGEKGEAMKLNRVVGSTPKVGSSHTVLSEAGVDAGRGLRAEGVTAEKLDALTPEQRAEVIIPKLNKAGQAVSASVKSATDAGVTLDVEKSAIEVLKKIPDPKLQQAGIDVINETAREIGITDVRKATPEQARALRSALRSHARFGPGSDLGSVHGIGTQLYRSVSKDLHDAVPGLDALDQRYADLKEAADANRIQMAKFGAGKSYSRLPRPPEPKTLNVAQYTPAEQKQMTVAKYAPAESKELTVSPYKPLPSLPSKAELRVKGAAKSLPWVGSAYGLYRLLRGNTAPSVPSQ